MLLLLLLPLSLLLRQHLPRPCCCRRRWSFRHNSSCCMLPILYIKTSAPPLTPAGTADEVETTVGADGADVGAASSTASSIRAAGRTGSPLPVSSGSSDTYFRLRHHRKVIIQVKHRPRTCPRSILLSLDKQEAAFLPGRGGGSGAAVTFSAGRDRLDNYVLAEGQPAHGGRPLFSLRGVISVPIHLLLRFLLRNDGFSPVPHVLHPLVVGGYKVDYLPPDWSEWALLSRPPGHPPQPARSESTRPPERHTPSRSFRRCEVYPSTRFESGGRVTGGVAVWAVPAQIATPPLTLPPR